MSEMNTQVITLPDELDDGGTGIEIEDVESEEHITQPFDPTLIRVSTKYMTLDLLLSRINDKVLELQPDFQRNVVWNEGAQSRLIESILIRIPLPAFYIDATDEDRWLVVDGLQRLTALARFVLSQELELTELEFLEQYNGAVYDQLPPPLQRRIKETQVTVYLIEHGTPTDVKFNIFKRINTGGLPLSAQEIRHALNPGPVKKFLALLADSKAFTKATDNSVRDKRMGDREMALRFLAFVLTPYTQYKTDEFDIFLNEAMAQINKMTEEKAKKLWKRFLRAMNAAHNIFGNDAFRKRYSRNAKRSPINKALFETWSVNLDKLDDEQLETLTARREEVVDKFIDLMNTKEFDSAISQGTGSIGKVKRRFADIEKLIAEVLS